MQHEQMTSYVQEPEELLLRTFRYTAAKVPAYARLLAEAGVTAAQVNSSEDFARYCPILSKDNTFKRFSLEQLCVPNTLQDLASVVTSSGHGGFFSCGLIGRQQAVDTPNMIDAALDYAFAVGSRRTLVINCLPMGVVFSSHKTTLATVSVREDMAVALIQMLGFPYYEQIVIIGDPLFLKRLMDFAAEKAVDWTRSRVNLVVGEEIFGENYRSYLAGCLGLNLEQPEQGLILASMGVGELGLHLFFETPETIALRRAAHRNPDFCRALLGVEPSTSVLPMLFVYSPTRIFVETLEADTLGYGALTISTLEPNALLPLLRYQTGDIARRLSAEDITRACAQYNIPVPPPLPFPWIALQGRAKDVLPNKRHVGQYKDALYSNPELARSLTGAFRLEFDAGHCTLHVQLTQGREPDAGFQTRLWDSFPPALSLEVLKLWPYEQFPCGMTLDYERKFSYYAGV